MAEYKGFVKIIGEKGGKSKKPPYRAYTIYSCKIEKDDGTEYPEWISLGFEAPPFQKGDYVKLEANPDGNYTKMVPGTAKVSKNPPARKAEASSEAAEGAGAVSSRGNYTPSKGGVDWNSSVARAIEMVELLSKLDALPITGVKGKSAEAKRFDEINAYVDKLTVRFYNDVKTLRLLDTVADTVQSTKADGALPGTDEEKAEGTEQETDDDENF